MRIPAIPELVGPLPLLATALVAVNDLALKRRFPGAVTGKLSDLAGAFVLPLLVSAVLALATRWPLRRRLAIGVAVTVVSLAAVKLSPVAGRAVAGVLDVIRTPLQGTHGGIAADPGDLVALPFALLAYAHGRRAGRRLEGETT